MTIRFLLGCIALAATVAFTASTPVRPHSSM
jgi:hypothetical protein